MSVLLALLIDRLLGEPPVWLHPVVGMGQYLKRIGRTAPDHAPWLALLLGTLWWTLGALLVVFVYGCAAFLLAMLPPWINILLSAVLLKPLFALRMLLSEVRAVEDAVSTSLTAGRARLAMIVSRETDALSSNQIRESALESLAENLSDSVIAPLFWFALLGLPGAALYRFANTADAMWGYRGRWEWAGKWAARADDLLNLAPARLTALALLLSGSNALAVLRRLPAEAARTASPNSGWPMGALALSLNVRLSKPRVYVLNATGLAPTSADIESALTRCSLAATAVALLFAALGHYLPWSGHV